MFATFDYCISQCERTALIRAAHEGRAECVQLLIDAGANINAADEVRSMNPCFCGVRVILG